MSDILNFFSPITTMQWQDVIDILIVTYLVYRMIPLVRSTGTARIIGMVVALVLLSIITEVAKLHTLHYLLKLVISTGTIALVVLYQPEIRRFVDNVIRQWWRQDYKPTRDTDSTITQVVTACDIMSKERTGALIVFARGTSLEEYTKTGTIIDGRASEQMIRNIFFNKSPLHDGAMIIKNGRIYAAGCVLPLSNSHKLSAELGTRHRAGVGVGEVSDAVVVIVSEETGAISLSVGGMLKRHLPPQMLERMLRRELMETNEQKDSVLRLILGKAWKFGAKLKKRWVKATKKEGNEDEE